jgi:hypothetical protein
MFICPKKILMALLFMLLAAPVAFQAVRSVLGGWIATAEGLPKIGGLAVHALVFMLLSTMIWRYAPFGYSRFEGDEEYRRVKGRRMVRRKAKHSKENSDEEAGAGPSVEAPLPGF